MALLELKNLHVALEDGTEIVTGVDLAVNPNEVHAIMGPNGSGKSTLAYALMGHPAYEITEGEVLFDGRNLVEMGPDERAQAGLFLGVQELVSPEMGAVVITHYRRILNYIKPDFVHVLVGGRIVEEGGPELAHTLEAEGYEAFTPVAVGEGGS